MSYAVVTADKIVFAGEAGVQDVATGAQVTPQTLYMACSTTKALTAMVVLRLVQDGAMELDAPLSRYVDHPYGDGVTAANVLAHTSGVPAPMPLDWFYVEGEELDRDAAYQRALQANPRAAGPAGEKYRYSNLGYWLLERAIENVTKRPYADAVRETLFAPLGVGPHEASFELPSTDLATGHSRKWTPTNALFYLLAPGRYWAESSHGWSRFHRLVHHGAAYGGLYTTTRAMAAVLQDLLRPEPRVLSAQARATMFSAQETTKGEAVGALGWVTGELDGHRYLGKQGGAIGFHGNIRVYPDLHLASVFFANSTRVSPGPIDALSDELDGPFLRFWARR